MSVNNSHPPIPVVITVILLLFFFFGIFCVYFCRCFLASVMTNWHLRRSPSGAIVGTNANAPTFGLHPDKIQALPAFKYCDVKDFRRDKYGLECAICLGEFRDDDLLRLLTTCCHVFHQDCIDLWLESHATCPVCRSDLDVPEETLTRSPILVRTNSIHEIAGSNVRANLEDGIRVNINEDGGDEVKRRGESSRLHSCWDNKERAVKFSRSNTTGHSITRNREDYQHDRYTLRLPDNVKINIIRGHNYAVSCITFGDFSSPSDTVSGGLRELSSACSEISSSIKERVDVVVG